MVLGDRMKYLVIGGVSYDTLIQLEQFQITASDQAFFSNETYSTIGGTGSGKAFCLDALGENVSWITAIGSDKNGEHIKDLLHERGITPHIIESNQSTAHTNIMYNHGNRVSIFTSLASVDHFDPKRYEEEIIEADVVFLNINGFCKEFIPLIQQHRKLCVVDLHDYDEKNEYHKPFLECADILFTSGVNLQNIDEYLHRTIKDKMITIVTMGKQGYYALDHQGNQYHGSAISSIEFVDSNGAGDSFAAGFMIEYMQSKNVAKALRFANQCGAISCSSKELFPK